MLQVILNRLLNLAVVDPTTREAGMERRRWPRLYTNLPVKYRVILQEPANLIASRASLKNISQGGAYLESDQPLRLSQGQVGHFTFTSLSSQEDFGAIYLAAKAIVRRIDRPHVNPLLFGMALEFLSGPLIFYQERSSGVN
jgi:hypothetical protein